MSVFSSGNHPMTESGKLEQCKRDYEAEILKVKEDNQATIALIEALEAYLDKHGYYDRSNSFTLPSLYGSLILEKNQNIKTIESLQEAWEREK